MKSNKKASAVEVDDIKNILEQLQSLKISDNLAVTDELSSSTSAQNTIKLVDKEKQQKILYFSLAFLAISVSAVAGYLTYNHSDKTEISQKPQKEIIEARVPAEQTDSASNRPDISTGQKDISAPPEDLSTAEKVEPPLQKPVTTPKPAKVVINPVIAEARVLIENGKIISARKLLLSEIEKDPKQAEIPFILAQTYDPNYLKDLQSFDAEAELGAARQWYETWYKVARNSANPPSPEKLDKILNALR